MSLPYDERPLLLQFGLEEQQMSLISFDLTLASHKLWYFPYSGRALRA